MEFDGVEVGVWFCFNCNIEDMKVLKKDDDNKYMIICSNCGAKQYNLIEQLDIPCIEEFGEKEYRI